MLILLVILLLHTAAHTAAHAAAYCCCTLHLKSLEVFYSAEAEMGLDSSPHEGEMRSYWLLMMAGGTGGSRYE
jgi:hypothetical protein